jgi:protoporphyrinogen oxidase
VSQRVVIVGAGVCGLTLGYQVARAGLPVTILEKQGVVGGLARGFHYGDFRFDVGPHRFYSPVTRVMNFVNETLGEDTASITRSSSVHFLGKYHDWPLKLKTVFQLPPTVSIRAFLDLLTKSKHHDPGNASFENYVLGKYGRTLYSLFFRDYTEKFLGIPAAETHQNWAKIGVDRATIDEKVDSATLQHIVKMMLIPKPREMSFVYPPGGVHVLCEKLRDRLREMGAEIRQNSRPTALLSADGEIRKVVTEDGAIDCKFLVWTAPIHELTAMLGLPDPNLQYLALLLFNTMTRVPNRHKVQWCYYGANDLIFSRISYPGEFHPSMVPAGKGSMCVEVTCREGDPRWEDPERLTARIRADLLKVGAIRDPGDIEDIRIERIDHAYPIYDLAYRDKLAVTKKHLETWRNISLGGRTGMFWYNNMDHSIANAFNISKRILGREVRDEGANVGQARRVLDELSRDPQVTVS